MKKTFTTSLGKATAFTAIALAATAAMAQNEERVRPLQADVKINKQLQITGQLPPGYTPPQFTFEVKVTENTLPPAPEGCKWEAPAYQPPGGNTTATTGGAAQVTVVNRLVCPPPPPIACQKAGAVNVSLLGAAPWNNPGNFANVSPLIPGWSTSGTVKWVGQNTSGSQSGAAQYPADITFCLCEGAKAMADVKDYIADNSASIGFDSGTFLAAAPHPAFSGGTSGSGSVSGTGTHKLRNTVTNNGGPTGWTMNGTLAISKGYLGACTK